MIKSKLIISILILPAVLSCSNDYKVMKTALADLGIPDNFEYVLILEQGGCSTCLYKADAFFSKHHNNQKMAYVFTGFMSEKRVKLKYDLYNKDGNIFIDSLSIMSKHNLQIDFPSFIKMEDNVISDVLIMSTSNFDKYFSIEDEILNSSLE